QERLAGDAAGEPDRLELAAMAEAQDERALRVVPLLLVDGDALVSGGERDDARRRADQRLRHLLERPTLALLAVLIVHGDGAGGGDLRRGPTAGGLAVHHDFERAGGLRRAGGGRRGGRGGRRLGGGGLVASGGGGQRGQEQESRHAPAIVRSTCR